MKKARNPAAPSAVEPGRDLTSQKECGALLPQRERRTKTHPDRLPFSDGLDQPCLVYQSALIGVKLAHFSGKSSKAKIAVTGQTGTQAPQSMHSTGLMYSCGSASNAGSSFRGWMQSTGQTSTHAVSFVPMQGSAITYAIVTLLRGYRLLKK
jgi:hypothetical protein